MAKPTVGIKDRASQRVAVGTLNLDDMTIEMDETKEITEVFKSFNSKFIKITVEEIIE